MESGFSSLADVTRRLGESSVVVVGDVMLDRYWHGTTSRISPEAPVPVVHVNQKDERPGGAANVALNVVALGAKARVIGCTGDDESANTLENQLAAAGVDCSFIRIPNIHTITKLRVMSKHQQLIRLDFEDGLLDFSLTDLENEFVAQLTNAGAVVLSDYGKGTFKNVSKLIRHARDMGIPVLVDPKGKDFSRYYGATILTPNLAEFEAVVGVCKDEEELTDKGLAVINELSLDALLITRSEHGMTLIEADKSAVHLPTHAREVYDVTGAGDTVIAIMATGLAAGLGFGEAMRFANLGAGIVVSKLGAAVATVQELRSEMYGVRGDGIQTVNSACGVVEELKARGEFVVMVVGHFDVLTSEHVKFLEYARSLGDYLLVGVKVDNVSEHYTSPVAAVNKIDARMMMLTAFECVDGVVPISEADLAQLVLDVTPNYFVVEGIDQWDCLVSCQSVVSGDVKLISSGFTEIDSIKNLINRCSV